MSRKAKFRPEITRIKLNPEQAVLNCSCFTIGDATTEETVGAHGSGGTHVCYVDPQDPGKTILHTVCEGIQGSASVS